MAVPSSYDPVTFCHWLWFKYQCNEAPPTEFQRLFESIMVRADPKFVRVRPYGRLGDRKCDGLFWHKGEAFQVYSPDLLTQAKVQKKIDEDLDGAVRHWGSQLKRWTFVYNARNGLPPDIPALLAKKEGQYPAVSVKHLSNDGLWEMAREKLSVQQRAEVLGPPVGYEHLFLAPASRSGSARALLRRSWIVIAQDVLSPINLIDAGEALRPGRAFGAPIVLHPDFKASSWRRAAAFQRSLIQQALQRGRDLIPRYATFSLAPIPLVVHLGFCLSERVEVRCFQFDRDRKTWAWPKLSSAPDTKLSVVGLPKRTARSETEAAIVVSLSAMISMSDVEPVVPNVNVRVRVSCRKPDVMWLVAPEQLHQLGIRFRGILASLRRLLPKCRRIHLFYAGPTGGAIVLGQQINPRMNPPVELYQYSRQSSPAYSRALTLTEDLA